MRFFGGVGDRHSKALGYPFKEPVLSRAGLTFPDSESPPNDASRCWFGDWPGGFLLGKPFLENKESALDMVFQHRSPVQYWAGFYIRHQTLFIPWNFGK